MIRAAAASDLPRLVELGAQMHAESPRYSRLAFDRARTAVTLAQLLESDDGFLYVAEHDGLVVGGLAGIASAHWCSHEKVATDLALFVEPAHRGGLEALRLVRTFIAWAGTRGARIVQLGVTTGIHVEQTARLYERIGLRQCGLIFEV